MALWKIIQIHKKATFCFALSLFFFSAPKLLVAFPIDTAQSIYLQKAIHALYKAKLERSRFLLAFGKKKEPFLKDQSMVLRLEALLGLFLGNRQSAEVGLQQAFDKKPLSGLGYFLGTYFLEQRRFEKAAYYFEKAAYLYLGKSKSPITEAQTYSLARHKLAYALEPALCPKDREELSKHFDKDWRSYSYDKKVAPWLWELISQPINRRQAALSAYQAYVFSSERREGLLALVHKLAQGSSSGIFALIADLNNDHSHRVCIERLKNISKGLRAGIKKTKNLSAKRQKDFVDQHTAKAYRNRMLVLATVKTAYAYGAYLLERQHFLTALHVLRHSLDILGSDLYGFSDQKFKILELQQILHALHSTYFFLRRRRDAYTIQKIINIIDDFSSLASSAETRSDEWVALVHMACKSDLSNREALLFLLAHARHKNISQADLYQKKLELRDKNFAQRELTLGYAYLRKWAKSSSR